MSMDLVVSRSMRPLLLAALAVATAGCAAVNARLAQDARVAPAVRQASFDHQCPQERISVLRHTANWLSLELDVCGRTRRYQFVGEGPDNAPGAIYVDTTDGRSSDPRANASP